MIGFESMNQRDRSALTVGESYDRFCHRPIQILYQMFNKASMQGYCKRALLPATQPDNLENG